MPKILCIPLIIIALFFQGCGSIAVLTFQPDKEKSGFTSKQSVSLEYVRPTTSLERQAGNTSLVEGSEFLEARIPPEIFGQCGVGRPNDVAPSYMAGATIPFVVAAGYAAFDLIVGFIDSKREKLKKAARAEYDATLVAKSLVLDPQPLEGSNKAFKKECIVLTRRSDTELAMALVLFLDRYAPLDNMGDETKKARGLTFSPAYLRIDLAAAETERVKDGKPKIGLTGSLAILAVQVDPDTGTDAITTVTSTPFSIPAVEIGTEYVNPDYVPRDFFSNNPSVKKLSTKKGPMFVPLRSAHALGSISIAAIELGAAAGFGTVDDTEKAIRTALRNAIGKSIEAKLTP